jgi:hypothetical protein
MNLPRRACLLLGILATLAAVSTAAGCSRTPGAMDTTGSHRVGAHVWEADGWIYYLGTISSDSETLPVLWRTRPGTAPERLEPRVAGCEFWGVVSVFPISDRLLGLVLQCAPGSDSVLASWDTSQKVAQPIRSISFQGGGVAWDSHDSTAIGSTEECGYGLARLEQAPSQCLTHAEALSPVTVGGTPRISWISHHCDTQMHEPEADTVAWSLCTWYPSRDQPKTVATGFTRPAGIATTSDGRTAFVAAAHIGQSGLWRVDLSNGTVTRVSSGGFEAPALSPDQRQVAVVELGDRDDVLKAIKIV